MLFGYYILSVVILPCTKEQAKQHYSEALKGQQMTYIYKGDELIAICTTLKEVKEIIGTDETLRRISYYKEKEKPIGDYIISGKMRNCNCP